MSNKTLISCVIFMLAFGVRADELTINPDHPGKYTVVKGDTLWDISGRFLEQPWRWPDIWDVNPQIENPHLIYPGDTVYLTYQDGQPVLSVARGGASGRNVKLSPQIRAEDHDDAIPSIPIDAIQQFLKHPIVLDDNELNSWPYVVSSYDQHLVASTGNTIYIRGIPEDSNVQKYSIYRKGPAYVNPTGDGDDKGEILGYEAIYVGDARIEKTGDPSSAIVTGVDREILVGDRLYPQSNEDIDSEFIPRPPSTDVKGSILDVVDGISQIGQYQIVVVNLGQEQGIEPGNVLGIYQSGKVVKDYVGPNVKKSQSQVDAERAEELDELGGDGSRTLKKMTYAVSDMVDAIDETFPHIANKQDNYEEITLPEEYLGVAMVFRTFNKVSYALIMETQGPVHVLDTVRNL